MPDLSLERSLAKRAGTPVAGLDEIGRGPWAGPVLACAVILPDTMSKNGGLDPVLFQQLNDSKKLTAARRARLSEALSQSVSHGFGEANVAEIDDLNILQASLLAMRRALNALPVAAKAAVVDGNRDPSLGIPTRLIVKGDSRSASIAAASILAKVARDRLMYRLSEQYPGYGWETNMGYGTKAHATALRSLGVTVQHRRSFAPVRLRLQSAFNI